MEIKFETERVTKNTVRFQEVDTEVMGTVYVSKAGLKNLGVEDPDKAKTLTLELKDAS